jgi:hypothetical protein
MVRKKKISLEGEVDEIENETIPELRELHEELKEKCAATDDPQEIAQFQKQSDRLEQQARFYKGIAETFREWLDEDPTAAFVIKELTADEKAFVVDEARNESFKVDAQTQQWEGTPRTEYAKKLTAQRAVVETPDVGEAPDEPEDIGDLPSNIFDWLFEEIDAHNTGGTEVELEGFTLSGALKNSES